MILTALVPGPRELPHAHRGTGIAISLLGGNFRFLIASGRNVVIFLRFLFSAPVGGATLLEVLEELTKSSVVLGLS